MKPQSWGLSYFSENKMMICQEKFICSYSVQKTAKCLWPAKWIWMSWVFFPSACLLNTTCLNDFSSGMIAVGYVYFVFKTFLKEKYSFSENNFYAKGVRYDFLHRWWVLVSSVICHIKLTSSFITGMVCCCEHLAC